MDREQADQWCEWAILGLVLLTAVFGPIINGAVFPQHLVFLETFVLLAVAFWVVRLWLDPKPKIFWPPICWAVLALNIYSIGAYFMAPLKFAAAGECTKVALYSLLFLVILNNLNRQEPSQIITYTLVGLAGIISAYAIYQFVTHSQKVLWLTQPVQYDGRAGGTYINPNHLAGFLEMILPLTLAFVLLSRAHAAVKVFLAYFALVILAGIAVTLSRGGWAVTSLTLAVFFGILIFKPGYRVVSLSMLALLLTLGVIFLNGAETKVDRRITQFFQSGRFRDARSELWPPTLEIWREKPWTGVGPAHYDHFFRRHRPLDIQQRPEFAHNEYLNALAEWGAIGLALFLAILGCFAWLLLTTWPYVQRSGNDLGAKRSNKAALVYGGAFSILAIALHSVTDFNLQTPANAVTAVIIMALVCGYARFATERHWWRAPAWAKFSFIGVLICVSVLLGIFVVRRGEISFLEASADRQADFNHQTRRLEQAFQLDSSNFELAFKIGEVYRLRSWEGDQDYELMAKKAMEWFKIAAQLNPLDPFSPIRIGMCLDWTAKTVEEKKAATPYFETGVRLDPNYHYPHNMLGWHYFQMNQFAEAKTHFLKSAGIYNRWLNPIADSYLTKIDQRLAEERALLPNAN
jgi:O-antigen ligase